MNRYLEEILIMVANIQKNMIKFAHIYTRKGNVDKRKETNMYTSHNSYCITHPECMKSEN